MSEYSYKRIGVDNLERIKQLRQVFAVAFEDDATWNSKPPSDSHLTKVLQDKNYIAIVAMKEGGEVVGGLAAYLLPKIEQERSEIYLYDLAVADVHRRKGVATKLIETLKEIGREAGAYVIFVQADNVDEAAVALYEKICESKETDISHFDIHID